MNVNYSDPAIADVVIPTDFLQKVYLGRCSFDFSNACSSPQGMMADFNVWSEFKSDAYLVDWTACANMEKGDLVNWDNARLGCRLTYLQK